MSLSKRLRERREQLGLTQSEVAKLLRITPSAIGNYENGVSTPKADILFRVFDALKCDANYLFQDEMDNTVTKEKATPYEMEQIIKKYRDLDTHGRQMVDFTLIKEWERSVGAKIANAQVSEYSGKSLKAAHNDYIADEGELEKIRKDFTMLQRPD